MELPDLGIEPKLLSWRIPIDDPDRSAIADLGCLRLTP